MKTKKYVIITAIIFIIITAGCVAIVKLSPPGFTNVISAKGEELIKTNVGDEFVLNYVTWNFPEYETTVDIIDASNKKDLGGYLKTYGFTKPEFIIQFDSRDLRCYQVENILIYKANAGGFKGINIGLIEDEKSDANTDLITILKALSTKKEWKWVKACGSFLLKSGDGDIRETLERYASDNFTKEELDINKSSEIKKEDMIAFAKQILEQK